MLFPQIWLEVRVACVVVASLFANYLGAAEEKKFVGSKVCATCHQEQYQHWQKSHHDQAMQEATADTVLGKFDGQTFTYFDVISTFFIKDNKYFVNTDGPDGRLAEFEIKAS